MPDVDLSVTVTVLDGTDALPAIVLTFANGYEIMGAGLGIGAKSFRRQTVESPYVSSRTLVGAVLDVVEGRLAVRVNGATHLELRTRINALVAAMEQRAFTLRINIEGNIDNYRCECADSAIGDGGTYDEMHAANLLQQVTFSFPHDPKPF